LNEDLDNKIFSNINDNNNDNKIINDDIDNNNNNSNKMINDDNEFD
jgi:hypothetical protein